MATILWGKPKFDVTSVNSVGASSLLTIPTPVQGSISLTTEAGEKHEANVEGGGAEAKRADKNSFTLEFSVRFAAERKMPFSDVSHDGNVTGSYKFVISDPENTSAPKMTMKEANVRYEDEFDPDDGARRHFYAESVVPTDDSDQIEWSDGALVSA